MKSPARHMIEETRLRIGRGDTLDEVLVGLRDRGASKIDTIIVLHSAVGMGLDEAKHAVHFSSAWEDVKERDEHLWDELEAGIEKAK